MKPEAFENVKNQIGFCGIWCGSCVVGNGTLRELTKRYEEIVRKYGLAEWAPKDLSFKEFTKGLVSVQAIPPCSGCHKGGGRDDCEMRTCALGKGVADCSECDQPELCENNQTLSHMRTGAQLAGLFMKTEKVNRKQLLAYWTAELKGRWPCYILFMDDKHP